MLLILLYYKIVLMVNNFLKKIMTTKFLSTKLTAHLFNIY